MENQKFPGTIRDVTKTKIKISQKVGLIIGALAIISVAAILSITQIKKSNQGGINLPTPLIGWQIKLDLNCGNPTGTLYFGLNTAATDSYDEGIDIRADVPSEVSRPPYFFFTNTYLKDIRKLPFTSGLKKWTIITNIPCRSETEASWDSRTLPSGYSFKLFYEKNEEIKAVDMATTNQLQVITPNQIQVSPINNDNWQIPIVLSCGTRYNNTLIFGTNSAATNLYDEGIEYRVLSPASGRNNFFLSNGFDSSHDYIQDLRSPISSTGTSTVSVPTNWYIKGPGGCRLETNICWNPASLPTNYDFMLYYQTPTGLASRNMAGTNCLNRSDPREIRVTPRSSR